MSRMTSSGFLISMFFQAGMVSKMCALRMLNTTSTVREVHMARTRLPAATCLAE